MPAINPMLTRIPSVSFADDRLNVPDCQDNTPVLPVFPVTTTTTRPPAVPPPMKPAQPPPTKPPAEPPPTKHWWQDQIQLNIPLPKVQRCTATPDGIFPPGSIFDPDELARPPLPSMPFDFPFDVSSDNAIEDMHPGIPPNVPSVMDSVTHVVDLPRVCGLVGDSLPTITVPASNSDGDATLVDSGANICVTGIIKMLVDVIPIPALPISVAVHGSDVSLDDCCTPRGLLPLTMGDGSVYYQTCYFCKNIVETIISPQAIVAGSDIFVTWQQTGHKDGFSGRLWFYSDSGLAGMTLTLKKCDGLYYAPTDVYTVDHNPVRLITPWVCRVVNPSPPLLRHPKQTYVHVTKSNQTESELWMLRLELPGEHQLDLLPGNATGIPLVFEYHPFRFFNFKEQARVRKQAAQRSAERTTEAKKRFYMDFGFMRSSRLDYSRPDKRLYRVIASWDGYSSYLLIVDEASHFIWVFLTKSKDPPIDIIDKSLQKFGHANGGSICTDQDNELAGSSVLSDMVLRTHFYIFEPTGADSPSQNGQAEIYNDKLSVRTRTLLYGAGLPAQYWSSALLHAVYLHNCLVYSVTKHTPFKGFFGVKPDLAALRVIGSWVCVKRTGHQRSKLDRHDFTGKFIGYTASDNNITYIDLDSGLVKTSHHAQFNEAS
jgi:hypothetical protein